LIEGNRGIFDGKDVEGSHTTAGLAALLQAPVILVLNATKCTRTLAAVVKGCDSFDPDVRIAGVILNRVAGERHRRVAAGAIEKYCSIPVLGALPKLGGDDSVIPGRHLGLITPDEFKGFAGLHDTLSRIASDHIDLDGILKIATNAAELEVDIEQRAESSGGRVRIGFFSDSVFTFYYPENLEALQSHGAELIAISSLNDQSLPEIDAFYIGGGFPETHAGRLSGNRSMLRSVREACEGGMPVYAECGGLIYLSRSLKWDGAEYPMADVFDCELAMHPRPMGHGYTLCEVDARNPFFAIGTVLKGHEFHYSGLVGEPRNLSTCFNVEVGTGLGGGRDALVEKSTLACYTHIHADGVKEWAAGMVRAAKRYRAAQRGSEATRADDRAEGDSRARGGVNTDESTLFCGKYRHEMCCQLPH
jgi:cobyrinic acid a,c-diamide synthase